MTRRQVTIATDDGVALETVVLQHHAPSQPFALLLVHQYSLLGGHLSLMLGMAKRFYALGYNCVTFNCRGVGASTGRATITGKAEIQDVLSVCDWISRELQQGVIIIGSSAGAPIAGSAVPLRESVRAFVAIGYTLGRCCSLLFGSHFHAILSCPKPKLFIMGSRDGFTSPDQLKRRLNRAQGSHNFTEIIPSVGHFALEGPVFDETICELAHRFIAGI